jgi:hypothetical protein
MSYSIGMTEGGNCYTEIRGEFYISGHFPYANLDQCHVVHGMLNIISEFPEIVCLYRHAIFGMTIVTNVEPEKGIPRCSCHEFTDAANGVYGYKLVAFDQLVVCAFVVVDNSFPETTFQAQKKLDRMAQVLTHCGGAEGLRGLRKILDRDLPYHVFQLVENRGARTDQLHRDANENFLKFLNNVKITEYTRTFYRVVFT